MKFLNRFERDAAFRILNQRNETQAETIRHLTERNVQLIAKLQEQAAEGEWETRARSAESQLDEIWAVLNDSYGDDDAED